MPQLPNDLYSHMPTKIRSLSKPLQEKAINELNEIPSHLQQDLQHLKDWLEKQEHLKYKKDDQFLISFLRGSKFSLQKAKEKIEAFYSFRILAPEITRHVDPFSPDMQAHLKLTAGIPLATYPNDPASPRVVLVRYKDFDPDEHTVTTMVKGESMAINVFINTDDNYVVSGAIMIFDMEGLKIKTALQLTPTLVKKIVICFEKALPTRMRAAYIINVPTFFEAAANMSKMLVSKKLSKRFHILSANNIEKLYKDIPKSIFPKEYGGDAGYYDDLRAEWRKTIENHRKMLLEEDNYFADKSKKLDNSRSLGDMYGIEGSFRNLDVD